MIRKIIIIAASALILFGGFAISGALKDSKKPPQKKRSNAVTTVFTSSVTNGLVPVRLNTTGTLKAKNRIDLYSEVQGIMTTPMGKFRAGTNYKRGATLVDIDSEVYEAGLMAQKSTLQNLVIGALPDIRLDYPSSFERWDQFLTEFDLSKALPKLPEPASDQEKRFISGRNIYSTYYNVRNMELTLAKYHIRAPFDGILTEANVSPGTLIRPGQKLGSFIQPNVYELETPVSSSMVNFLSTGQTVELRSTDDLSRSWTGRISRINSLVNSGTQTVNVYIEVQGFDLEEGMFLQASINATELENAFEIERSVLFNKDQLYVVDDTLLVQKQIQALHFNENTVVVRGLDDGDQVLTKLPPSAYPGMRVSIYREQSKESASSAQ